MIDETKVLIVAICKNEIEQQQQLSFFKGNTFSLSAFGISNIDFRTVIRSEKIAETYNQIQNSTDAKYKIFLTAPLVVFDSNIIDELLKNFFIYPKVGIVGLLGSEIPISGDYTKAQNFYGSCYCFSEEEDESRSYVGKMPVLYQSVHMIDSGFFATSENIPFDEDVGEDFVMAAQCCRYRRAGYDVGVTYLEGIKIAFSENHCVYSPKNDVSNYEQQLKQFVTLYKDVVTPLVSICIPTYNQPQFCELALQSALAQIYPNIEIIVGDDSTNESTKEMIQPYLQQCDNVKYFYHNGPLGKKGGKNTTFIINKSTGKYINLLFHDDFITVDKISRMMEYFIRDLENRITLAVSARVTINEKDEIMGRFNPYQPLKDEILSGNEVGRRILFSKINFLGEMSTSLIKRSSLLVKDPETGENFFDLGIFCGVKDVAYGDIGTWLNLLKNGGECLFLKDSLSAFRQHPAQNTYDPAMRVRLMIEMFNYITISWLNNLYLKDFDEYKFCCKHWVFFFDSNYVPPKTDDESDDLKFIRATLLEIRKHIVADEFAQALDCSIRFLLDVLEERNSIRPLIRQSKITALWEKANDGIALHGEQRC